MFECRLNTIENKFYIIARQFFDAVLKIQFCDTSNNIIYETNTKFQKDVEYWYAPANEFKKFKEVHLKILDNETLIFEKYISNNYFIRNGTLVKKPALLIHSNCFGDTLNVTPLIRTLSNAYQTKIDIFTYIPEIFINSPYIDKIYNINDSMDKISGYELYEVGKHMMHSYHKHIRKTYLVDFFTMDLGFTLNASEKQLDFFPDPWINNFNLPEKYICINPSISWPSRTWSLENWQELISKIDMKIVILGKKIIHDENDIKSFMSLNNDNIIDLTEKTTLSEAWHIINNSELFITTNSGLLCLAGTTDAEIIEIGNAIHYLARAPYRKGSQDYKYKCVGGDCKIYCGSNLKYSIDVVQSLENYPIGKVCLEHYSTFKCHPTPEQVFEEIIKKNEKF